jgi:hypothetical protein
MPPSAYPDDNWGKKEYLDDVKWYQRSMTSVNQMDLTRKQRSCCENITKTITESIRILRNTTRQLRRAEKQKLYELAESRSRYFASFFIKE